MTNASRVIASNARPTRTGAEGRHGPGVDVDVAVTLPDGSVVDGGVTLLPSADGRHVYELWGSVDNWLSSDLVRLLDDVRSEHGADERINYLEAIESEASAAAGVPW